VRTVPETDDEVGRLTASFNVMTRRLAEQQELEAKLRLLERSAMLSEMASSVAHEIRNPLNLINLTADHLGRQYQPEGEESQKSFQELIARLKTKVRQIDQMVTDILKIGRPLKLKRTTFTWNELFEEVERSLKSQLVSKGVDVEFSGRTELSVNADREQMRLALSNLLVNAIHSVEGNGRITIEVEQGNGANGAAISVADTGKGVPAEDLATIFEPYSAKHPGGTGLELALVRRIIEEHGGKIHAANKPDGGTRFEFTLPTEA
jgi:signal transduction histidine kinase